MKIIKMVGERNKKAQRKKAFIQRVKQAICIWLWVRGRVTHIGQSMQKRMETITTISSAKQSRTCANSAMIATAMKHQHGRNWTMKGKCKLCEAKSQNEFCPSCVCYLQRKANKVLVNTRKMMSYTPDQYANLIPGGKSNFFSLQCKYDERWTIHRSNKLLTSQEVDGLQINPLQERGWRMDVLPIRHTGFGQGWDWRRGLHGISNQT